MILFIAPNPHKVKEREGFLQRVAAIDEIFKDEEKVYFEDVADPKQLLDTMIKAQLIYVHSIYQAEEILYAYPLFAEKIVTDLHGVVPEEEKFAGNLERAAKMGEVEKTVFQYGNKFVAVTQAMAEHFVKKYKLSNAITWVVLPIFNAAPNSKDLMASKNGSVVYAGGAQSWQNVPLMVEAINQKAKDHEFTILTHSPDAFGGIEKTAMEHVVIKTVPSSQVSAYYKQASLGFILRDDITVNNVACPTKLIEYLSYGVVPIVLSPKVGDFEALGYAYVTFDNFMKTKLSMRSLIEAARVNQGVIEKLTELTASGTKKLKHTYASAPVARVFSDVEYPLLVMLIEQAAKARGLEKAHAGCGYQIDRQRESLAEYAKSVEYYRKQVEDMTHSKRWMLLGVLKKPWTVRRLLTKR